MNPDSNPALVSIAVAQLATAVAFLALAVASFWYKGLFWWAAVAGIAWVALFIAIKVMERRASVPPEMDRIDDERRRRG